jgi:hypothetical protein
MLNQIKLEELIFKIFSKNIEVLQKIISRLLNDQNKVKFFIHFYPFFFLHLFILFFLFFVFVSMSMFLCLLYLSLDYQLTWIKRNITILEV